MTTEIRQIVRPLDPQALIEAHVKATTGVHGVGESGVESKAGAQAKADAVRTDLNAHTARTDNPHAVTAPQVGAAPSSHTHVVTDITGVPAARVYHDAAQSILNATYTILAFNSERFDTDNIHDTATHNSRLTCKTAGIYLIVLHVRFAANATGVRLISIKLNGTTNLAYNSAVPVSGGVSTAMALSTIYQLAVGDYVEAQVYQNSGGALNVDRVANDSPEFMMVRVG